MNLLALLNGFLNALSAVAEYFSGERLRKLGRLEEQQKQTEARLANEAIAKEVDARPVPTDKRSVLGGLLKPDQRPRSDVGETHLLQSSND